MPLDANEIDGTVIPALDWIKTNEKYYTNPKKYLSKCLFVLLGCAGKTKI